METQEQTQTQEKPSDAMGEQGSQTTSTPETPPEQPNRLLELMEANMREQAQRLRALESENNQLRNVRQTEELNPPIQPGQQDAEAFWRDPAANIQRLIREETQRAVKPLYDFKTQMERQSGYDGLKNRFRADRRYAEMFPKIEALVDQLMSNADPTEQNMQLAVLSAIGTVVTGQAPGVTIGGPPTTTTQPTNGQPPQTTQETRVITPAHLRSSPPQPVVENAPPKLRDLTELESRLARERGQSKEEFLQWLDVPATEVATSRIGKPEKPPENPNPQSQVQRNINQGGGR